MSEWRSVPLGYLSTQRKGINYKSEDYCDENTGHPFITIKCFVKGGGYEPTGIKFYGGFSTKADYLEPGDILFSVTDLTRAGDIVGSPLRVPEFRGLAPALASIDCMRVDPIADRCDKLFLYHRLMLSDIRRQMVAYSAGSTVLHLDTKKVPCISVRVPVDITTQAAIAKTLDALDQTIEKTEALVEKYQQIKAGLMHDLFTRGIGTDGKLRPPREQAPELYQETPIGWIPKEWDYAQLRSYVRSAQYGISTSLDDSENGIPVLRMNNIQMNRFDVSDLKYTTNLEAYTIKLKRGDVLYNRTNSMEHVGKTAIWRDELQECSFASYLVRINLQEDKILQEFFSHWMSQVAAQNALRRYATPAVQQVNINPTNLQKIYISCPKDIDEQQLISMRIDTLDAKISNEQKLLDKLRDEKSGLMHDLLTGKVPVKVDPLEAAHV